MFLVLFLALIPVLLIQNYSAEKIDPNSDSPAEQWYAVGVLSMSFVLGLLILKQCLIIGLGPDESLSRFLLEIFILFTLTCTVKLCSVMIKSNRLANEEA